MGVSKFFRWMSERYPYVLQLVEENRIPQFDNLYLDMNGIIHHCSHPNEGSAHFRITDQDIYLAIFSYLEHLFALAKPQKVFFLAVDGVAPRAKMNQQRSRRFKTAKENQELIEKAIRKGEKLPDTTGFDSNCITPGTAFMARLSEQLKYFINKKVSEDSAWQSVQVIFSGHDVPGEGEHKIMEYIRLSKAQEDYNPNIRHCVYGLDADLIMLALLSHDPHFCLLREEVKFSSQKSSSKGLENQKFYLLHISLVRDYLDWEFASLKTIKSLEYDLERIIDDFILLCIFVGNDFLPHLPNLHINEGALGLLFDIYKKVLPEAGGYLNEFGTLHVERLQLILNELNLHERENFEHICADSSWIESKRSAHGKNKKKTTNNQLILSESQRTLLGQIEEFVRTNLHSPNKFDATLSLPASYPAKDRKFLRDIAVELSLFISFDEFNENDEPLITLAFDPEQQSMGYDPTINSVQDMLEDFQLSNQSTQPGLDRSLDFQVDKVFHKYTQAVQEPEWNEEDFDKEQEKKFQNALSKWKSQYYSEKMNLDFNDPEQVHKLAYAYTEGLQWVLHYYYDGVASWSWFYPYHYSPMISDLSNVASYKFSYNLGKPFKPFEQLMGVLPELSSAHVPPAFRELMINSESPIVDLYPREFETDLNGKKFDWEAIVKIPFIDQDRLLKAMKAHGHKLLDEERRRNEFGPTWQFRYNPETSMTYPSSLQGFFPDFHNCHSDMTVYDLPTIQGLRLIKGLCKGVLLGKDTVAGFPSLHNLPHTGTLRFHGIKVHQSESKGETIVIDVQNLYEGTKVEDLANTLLGSRVYVAYPFLREAKVTGISDNLFRYDIDPNSKRCRATPHEDRALTNWQRNADGIEYELSKKCGLVIGDVDVIVHAKPIKGLQRMDDGALVKEYESRDCDYALQTVVLKVSSVDPRFMEQSAKSIIEEFPEGSKVFFLGSLLYGAPGQIIGHSKDKLDLRIMSFPTDKEENFAFRSALRAEGGTKPYVPSHVLCRRIGISGLTLSKLTSSIMIMERSGSDNKTNIGLSIKFEAKSQKVLGYTQKTDSGWEYSFEAVKLIEEYIARFPEIIDTIESRGSDILRAHEIFPDSPEARLGELKSWIKSKGVRDFERVGLENDSLDRKMISEFEIIVSRFLSERTPENVKQAIIRGVPRKAILKPSHAEEILGKQSFDLADRVTMVSDRGTVPISSKGVVVGINDKLIDVVFDNPFIGGTSLSNRCEMYRGVSISPSTILNLTTPQFCQSITGGVPREKGGRAQPHVAVQSNETSHVSGTHQQQPAYKGRWQTNAVVATSGSPRGGQPVATSNGRGGPPTRGRGGWAPEVLSRNTTTQPTFRSNVEGPEPSTMRVNPNTGPTWRGGGQRNGNETVHRGGRGGIHRGPTTERIVLQRPPPPSVAPVAPPPPPTLAPERDNPSGRGRGSGAPASRGGTGGPGRGGAGGPVRGAHNGHTTTNNGRGGRGNPGYRGRGSRGADRGA
ncbi:hypothetical protein MJO28_017740 [Puccinia striiformis f. sp. tritici]|uniref:5'-3' exoribonuclease 1 n=1 Tax=Puccinia striiformis TaxID=27350 RepID=A0A2S4VUJ0_9BASI|nr:hypothetical protein MJO28_017740 [Puccinia striiformis f. sp. tritici]POW13194.1 hypothetical protein PSTT_03879 [Puccinia striiformis]